MVNGLKRLLVRVFGRVQGIGFRSFVKAKAESLFLRGFVRNLPDGSVEIQAEGEEKNLHLFLDVISKGPMFADVDSVETDWSEASGLFIGFEVRK